MNKKNPDILITENCDILDDKVLELKTSLVCDVQYLPDFYSLEPDKAVNEIGSIIPTLTYTENGWAKVVTYQNNVKIDEPFDVLTLPDGTKHRVCKDSVNMPRAANKLFCLEGEERLVPIILDRFHKEGRLGEGIAEKYLLKLSEIRKQVVPVFANLTPKIYLWLVTDTSEAGELLLLPSRSGEKVVMPEYVDPPKFEYITLECITP